MTEISFRLSDIDYRYRYQLHAIGLIRRLDDAIYNQIEHRHPNCPLNIFPELQVGGAGDFFFFLDCLV